MNGDQPRRVLVAHPSAELYGSDRVLLESVRALTAAGAMVTVALPTNGPLVPLLVDAGAAVVIAPTLVLRKRLLRPSGWPALLADTARGIATTRRILRRVRPDTVLVNTVTLPLWVALGRRGRLTVHVHEAEASAAALVRRALYAPLLLAGTVVVNSRFSRDVIATVYPSVARRATVLRNPVSLAADVSPARRELTGAARILYVGRLSPRKGPDVAVSAVAELRRRGHAAELVLLGDTFPGYEWFVAELTEQVERLGLHDAVRFAGFHPDVMPFLESSDIVVIPSRLDEPFGNTAVEGLLSGRPTVVSDTSGLREAVESSSAVLVPPGDPGALADALEGVIGRWAEARDHAARDAETAERAFAPELYRARLASLVLQRTPERAHAHAR